MRTFLEKSSHDAIITVFILAQKGKMAFKTPFVPRELNESYCRKILILDDVFSKKTFLSLVGFVAIITFAAVGWIGWMAQGQVYSRSFELKQSM